MALARITLSGLDELTAAFVTAGSQAPAVIEQALREEADEAFRLSQEVVPVEFGVLRSSGTVKSGRTGSQIWAQISYGGSGADYAIYVHEIPPSKAKHAPPTRWKYLEYPVKEYSKGMEGRLRVRMLDIIVRRFAI